MNVELPEAAAALITKAVVEASVICISAEVKVTAPLVAVTIIFSMPPMSPFAMVPVAPAELKVRVSPAALPPTKLSPAVRPSASPWNVTVAVVPAAVASA